MNKSVMLSKGITDKEQVALMQGSYMDALILLLWFYGLTVFSPT